MEIMLIDSRHAGLKLFSGERRSRTEGVQHDF